MKLPNRELRFLMLDMANLDVGRHFSNRLNKQSKSFCKNTMHYSARRLWYRITHQQSSNKLAMFQRHLKHAESDWCGLCNEVENVKHLLIICWHKLDVETPSTRFSAIPNLQIQIVATTQSCSFNRAVIILITWTYASPSTSFLPQSYDLSGEATR